MSLVRALHGRAAMAGVGAPWPVMGELAGEGREGEWEVERWVRLGGGVTLLLCVVSVRFGTVLREEESRKEEGEEKREKRKEEGKEKKKKNPNLEIFGKNER
jgi:hypothetical protein